MSWTVNPGMLIGPIDSTFDYHFGVSQQRMSPVLIGAGDDASRYCYRPSTNVSSVDVYTVSEQISYAIKIGSDVLYRQPGLVHDMPWFAGWPWILYYHPLGSPSSGGAHVLIASPAQPGYLPAEFRDPTAEVPSSAAWMGDSWWSGNIPIAGGTGNTTLVPRGSNKDAGSSKTAEFHWPRWIKDGSPGGGEIGVPAGTYTPVSGSGVSGTVTVGMPVWRDAANTDYIRSRLKTSGRYTYGAISYNADAQAWVIGTPGDEAGWWVGDEPSLTSAKTFAFTVPDGSEVTGDDIVVTFNRYTLGTGKTQRWLAEAGVIR